MTVPSSSSRGLCRYKDRGLCHNIQNRMCTGILEAWTTHGIYSGRSSSCFSGTELPLMVESYGLLNDIFPFSSIHDADYPIFNLHLANVLFDVILLSVLG